MTVTKHLLLGSAAALVVSGSAQSADLPVKARAVEYVKICSLYGEGFYYIPGTDVCLKIGGYVRADYGWNVAGSGQTHYTATTGGAQDRTVNPYASRHRAHFNFDSRSQTAYGTLRTYVAIHIENRDQNAVTVSPTRAFIQWAGFTFGHTKSFTDVPGTPNDDGWKSLHQTQSQSDTGANGTNQIAYTWELGNGMTLNIGADERRTKGLANLSNNVYTVGSATSTGFGPFEHPNPWLNFAVNQAWGRFATSFIANKVNAQYYNNTLGSRPDPGTFDANGVPIRLPSDGTPAVPGTGCPGGFIGPTAQPGTSQCGYPDDKWGWAVLSGIDIKAPWAGPGDHFGGYFNYGVGAAAYAGGSNLASPGLFAGGNRVAWGMITDAVYVNGSDLQLTTTWTAGAGFEHFWLPNFSQAVYGTYTKVSYNDTVVDNCWFGGGNGGTRQNLRGSNAASTVVGAVCDPSFNFWTVGLVTNWYPAAGFRLAVDVLYTRVETAESGRDISLAKSIGGRPTGVYSSRDQGIASVVFRAQRSFATGE